MENNMQYKVSKEEYKRILSLPKKTGFFAEKGRLTGLYDENEQIFYILDEDEKLTGFSSFVPREKFIEEEARERAYRENSDIFAGKHVASAFTAPPKKKRKKGADFAVICAAIIAALAIVATFLFCAVRFHWIDISVVGAGTDDVTASIPSISIDVGEYSGIKNDQMVEVAVLAHDVNKGDQITLNDVLRVAVRGDFYNSGYLLGERAVRWEEAKDLFPGYSTKFAQGGQVLFTDGLIAYSNVSSCGNPWISDDEAESLVVMIPVQKDGLVRIGENVDISGQTRYTGTSAIGEAFYTDVPNIWHDFNYSETADDIESFHVTNAATVCDVISTTGESLFSRACVFAELPYGDAITGKLFDEPFVPQYYKVIVDAPQGRCVQEMLRCGLDMSIEATGSIDMHTPEKELYAVLFEKYNSVLMGGGADGEASAN